MTDKAKIKEIFASIQGEGPYIGYKQLFIRFCGCNLRCGYCDTDYDAKNAKSYSPEELAEIVEKYKDCHSISLTGGEPLLNTEFLKDFLPLCPIPVYLETNATLAKQAEEIIDFVDYVSADIKLPSCTGIDNLWEVHDKFFESCKSKDLFAKVVFDTKITEEEISKTCALGAKYAIELIIQPKTDSTGKTTLDSDELERIHDRFLKKYKKVRLIPQVHKYLDLR